MKKIIFSLGLAIAFILLNSLTVFGQTPYPEPVGYVNDFANIIPDDVEQRLEQTLRDYETKTTNEIAVVTVQSLDGKTVEDYTIGLAEKWKVGKEGKNNGVIILVAPNERAVRIEVGYGLEPVLTDSKAGSIINKMTPFFKEGNYAGGIETAVREVIGTIGYLTPEQIEQQKKEQEEKNRATTATLLKVLMYIGIAVVLIILIVVLCKKVSAWQKEEKRKEAVRRKAFDDLKVADDSRQKLTDAIGKLFNDKEYPATMEKELADLSEKEAEWDKLLEDGLQAARKLLKKNPDLAKRDIANQKYLADSFRETVRAFGEKQRSFDEARISHAEKIKEADQAIQSVLVCLRGLKEKEYFVFPDKELAAAQQEVNLAQAILSSKDYVPDYQLAIKYAESAVRKSRAVKENWEKRLATQRVNAKNLRELLFWIEGRLPELKKSCQTSLEQLKTKAPAEVWEHLVRDIKEKETAFEMEFGTLIGPAEHLNQMDKQEFEKSAKAIEEIYDSINAVELSLRQPDKTLDAFITAQKEVKTLTSQAAQVMSRAESAVSDSDAEGAGRGKLKEAKDNVSKVKNLEKSDLPNWLLLAGLLAGAITLARAAESEAKQRADEVERARRRKREEEERRRRSSYHSSDSSSWSSGSSHSGGSFGGFGGGSFGGGGASGHF